MRIVISQPRYLPFVPYLQRLKQADLFIFLDDVQRQSRGFENRNKILLTHGPTWLTIPIKSSSRALICNTQIEGDAWIKQHKHLIKAAYSKHPFYSDEVVEAIFDCLPIHHNSSFSMNVIKTLENICLFFNIEKTWLLASTLDIPHDKSGPSHLADIAMKVGATEYISGANGKEYGIETAFNSVCPVRFHIPTNLPYKQPASDDFIPYLSFFDELFTLGKKIVQDKISTKLILQ